MKRLKKIGLKGFKFRFEFQIGQALNLPSDVTLAFLTITRGPKVGQSKRVVPSGAKAEWSETIVILSTLYKESKSPRFESKEARVSLKMPSGKTGYKKVGTTTVDLADYCNNEGQQQEVNVLLDGKSKSKASVMIRMVVKATFVANAEDDDSASEVSDMTHITMGSEGSSGKDDESLHGGNIELPSPTIGQPSPAASGRVRHNSIASPTLTETKPFAKKDVSKETEPPR